MPKACNQVQDVSEAIESPAGAVGPRSLPFVTFSASKSLVCTSLALFTHASFLCLKHRTESCGLRRGGTLKLGSLSEFSVQLHTCCSSWQLLGQLCPCYATAQRCSRIWPGSPCCPCHSPWLCVQTLLLQWWGFILPFGICWYLIPQPRCSSPGPSLPCPGGLWKDAIAVCLHHHSVQPIRKDKDPSGKV